MPAIDMLHVTTTAADIPHSQNISTSIHLKQYRSSQTQYPSKAVVDMPRHQLHHEPPIATAPRSHGARGPSFCIAPAFYGWTLLMGGDRMHPSSHRMPMRARARVCRARRAPLRTSEETGLEAVALFQDFFANLGR